MYANIIINTIGTWPLNDGITTPTLLPSQNTTIQQDHYHYQHYQQATIPEIDVGQRG